VLNDFALPLRQPLLLLRFRLDCAAAADQDRSFRQSEWLVVPSLAGFPWSFPSGFPQPVLLVPPVVEPQTNSPSRWVFFCPL
jgi:hypothetical protein